MPSLPLAHEKWFVDDPASFGADWDFALAAPSLILIAAVAVVALVWHVVGGRPSPLRRGCSGCGSSPGCGCGPLGW